MKTADCTEYRLGRRLLLRPSGDSEPSEIMAFIEAVCRAKGILAASFSVSGSVDSAAIGVYDAGQQVYVTHTEKESTEILSCSGTISQTKGTFRRDARIVLADRQGRLTGGRLFTATTAPGAEIHIQELLQGK